MSEFELIDQLFAKQFAKLNAQSEHLSVGIGDDAALISFFSPTRLVVSSDLLISGRHFFADADPWDVGFKSLAVNLSDIAAMGAKPVGFTLSLGLPAPPDIPWLESFSRGLLAIASQFQCPLVGGDTTACHHADGPIISVTVFGQCLQHQVLLRSGILLNDDIWVSGLPGKARLGFLQQAYSRDLLHDFLPQPEHEIFHSFWKSLPAPLQQECLKAVQRPQPEVVLGLELAAIANSAIDLSDGFCGDLKHMLKQSGCGAVVQQKLIDALWCDWYAGCENYLSWLQKVFMVGGDDYALCFSANPNCRKQLLALSEQLNIPLTCVGSAQAEKVLMIDNGEECKPVQFNSFDHFKK